MGGIMKSVLILVFVTLCVSLFALADIQVSYTGFSTEQQAAFEHAVSIWEPILNSDVPINIHATLQTIPGFVVITLPNLIRNFAAAPVQNVWFSTALANALSGSDLNPTEADVDFIINPSQPWYYGLDGECPAANIDFVTEMMKAVAYGLGYQSSFYVQQGYGSYGMIDPSVLGLSTSFVWEPMQNMPALYDTFICNTQGQYLTNTALFGNPSTVLNAQLSGGNLRYHGPHAMLYNAGDEPVLYAGSFNLARTARLLEAPYESTENASGVPTAYTGMVIHYPAPIVLGMLEDQGWEIDHTAVQAVPTDLIAVIQQDDVLLNWTAPQTPYVVHNYTVCRDGMPIGTVLSNSYADLNLPPGIYAYTVEAAYSMGMSEPSNIISIEIPVAVEDEHQVPAAGNFFSLYPNPFRNTGTLALSLKSGSPVVFELYNLKGRKLGEYAAGQLGGGEHQLGWDIERFGCSDLPAGVYFLKCIAGAASKTERFLLID